MKIYILPVSDGLQPKRQPFRYPKHNKDYGIEQDFLTYLRGRQDIVVNDPQAADWHYLPVFWTRYHLNHDYGKTGREELADKVGKHILDETRTFTVCQYADGPLIDVGEITLFLSSRKTTHDRDVPLLCSPHRLPLIRPRKRYLASFSGRFSTHPLRSRMADVLKSWDRIEIVDSDMGRRYFVRQMLSSYIALCPRGHGGSSFRFYEAMQLETVPLLIGDLDTRPFKQLIDWDSCSLYCRSAEDIESVLREFSEADLTEMGKRAGIIWRDQLTYHKWCKYVILELMKEKV